MRQQPTALGAIDPDSPAPDWHRAQVQRLARQLGYVLAWPPPDSVLPLVDQVRQADVDVVIAPSPDHLDALTLNAVMGVVDIEMVCPRLTFSKWADMRPGSSG